MSSKIQTVDIYAGSVSWQVLLPALSQQLECDDGYTSRIYHSVRVLLSIRSVSVHYEDSSRKHLRRSRAVSKLKASSCNDLTRVSVKIINQRLTFWIWGRLSKRCQRHSTIKTE